MKWIKLPQEGDVPQARSSHSLTWLPDGSERLALWGGENTPRVPIGTEMYLYDMPSGKWTVTPGSGPAPSLRVAHAAAAVGSTLYIHGGRTEVAEQSSLGDLHSFDFPTATWAELHPQGKTPPSRNYHVAVSVGASLYIFGGCGQAGRMADLWRYDTASGAWEELPSSADIKGRGGAGFVAQGEDALIVVGGFTGTESSDVHRFDLRAQRWERLDVSSTVPVPFTARSVFARASHACDTGAGCGHAGHVLVFGGEVDPSDLGHSGAGQFSDQTFCLDPSALTWHGVAAGGEAPGPRGWAASAAAPAGLVVSGGIDEANARLGDLYLLDMHA